MQREKNTFSFWAQFQHLAIIIQLITMISYRFKILYIMCVYWKTLWVLLTPGLMYSLIVDSPWFNILWSIYCLYCIVSPIQYAHSWTSALTAHSFWMSFCVLSRQSQPSHPSKPSSPFSYTAKFCLLCSLWWCLPSLN